MHGSGGGKSWSRHSEARVAAVVAVTIVAVVVVVAVVGVVVAVVAVVAVVEAESAKRESTLVLVKLTLSPMAAAFVLNMSKAVKMEETGPTMTTSSR